jgi:hypothetical protein
MNDLRTAAQQALEALEKSRVFVTTREKIKHPEGTEWYDGTIAALRDALAQPEQEAATELRRLHAENETLRQQHLEAHRNSSTIFAALVEISMLTHLGGEVAEYGDVVEAVRQMRSRMISEGWRQCAKGQKTTQWCAQAEQARLEEREACAKVCDPYTHGQWFAAAIRARGQPDPKVTHLNAWARDRLARHGIQIPEDDDANPSF